MTRTYGCAGEYAMMDRVHSKVGKLLAESIFFVVRRSVASTFGSCRSLAAMRPEKMRLIERCRDSLLECTQMILLRRWLSKRLPSLVEYTCKSNRGPYRTTGGVTIEQERVGKH
jgi:hypothetical protein